jgi:hypothetical protein
MIFHREIANNEFSGKRKLNLLIRSGKIVLGGNIMLKIYGRLDCDSGKRMKIRNRVFFESEAEAITLGYRPCGHCMRNKYEIWKRKINNKRCGKKFLRIV